MTQNQFVYSGVAVTAQLLCVILMTVFIRGRTGCTFKKLGWRTDHSAFPVQRHERNNVRLVDPIAESTGRLVCRRCAHPSQLSKEQEISVVADAASVGSDAASASRGFSDAARMLAASATECRI